MYKSIVWHADYYIVMWLSHTVIMVAVSAQSAKIPWDSANGFLHFKKLTSEFVKIELRM
jgi:hypothetical protein